MPGSQELIQIIDTNILKQDVSTTLIEIGKIDEAIKKIAPFATGLSTGSSAAFRKQSQQMVAAMQQIADMQTKLITLENQLQSAQTKGATSRKAMTDEQLRVSIQQTIDRKKRVDDIKAETDAYKELDNQYRRAAANAKTLQAKAIQSGNPADQSAANTASAAANAIAQQLKIIDSSVGQNQRKVGDYTGALKVLEHQLATVQANMTTLSTAGNEDTETYAKLNEEANLLSTILGQQEKGFASVTAQARSLERALQSMNAAGLEGTPAFNELREAAINASTGIKELQREQKMLESEAPLLGSIALAAKALGGAYAIGAGAAALFADGNEKVEKEINKLVAIMTILQGLNEVYELTQKAGAISEAFRLAKLDVLTTATELYTEATGIAAEATTAFDEALIATGIGAVIVGLAVAIGLLIMQVKEWSKATELNEKEQKQLVETLTEVEESIQKIIIADEKRFQREHDFLENSLSLLEANKVSQEEIFAAKKRIADLDEANAQKKLNELSAASKAQGYKTLNDQLNENIEKQKYYAQVVKDNQELIAKGEAKPHKTDLDDEVLKDLKEYTETQQAKYNLAKKTADDIVAAQKDFTESISKQDDLEAEHLRYTEDEKRKIILENIKLTAQIITNNNQLVLGDERSTQEQRLRALRSNAAEQRSIIQGELSYKESDPAMRNSITGEKTPELIQAEKDAAAQIAIIRKNSLEEQRKLNYDYYERDKEARLQITAELLNGELAKNEEFLNNDLAPEQKTSEDLENYLAKRTEALQSSYIEREAIINAAYLKERSDAQEQGKTFLEIEAIDEKHAEDLAKLKITYDKQVTDEGKHQLQDRLNNIEQFYKDEKRVIDKSESDKIVNASNKYVAGKTSYDGYNKEKAKAEFEERKKDLEAQQREIFNKQAESAKALNDANNAGNPDLALSAGNDLKGANDEMAKNQIAQAENIAARKKELQDEALEKEKLYAQAVIDSTDLVKTAVDARYENELNYIDRLMARNNLLKGEEKDRIKTSTLSEQEKDTAIARIDAQAAARNRQLAHEAAVLKHKQAVTDKAFNVAEAIQKGIIMILSAANPVIAAVTAVFTGIEVAKIAATPIPPVPAYAIGTDNHPGGPFIAGEQGPELRIDPSGKTSLTPGVPTLMHGEKGMRIIPNNKLFANADMVNNVLLGQIFKQQAAQIQKDDTGKKIDELTTAVQAAAHAQVSAIRKVSVHTIINVDSKFPSYIDKRIRR